MLSINTNLPSLIAQNSLKTSTKNLNTAIERMTTGFKINSAKDNAANYSITTNMTTQISAYQVAEDNVAMGLDMLSTTNESLDLISDKLSRLRALAEQAANGTYGNQSLKAINAESQAIVDEIIRLYNTSEYNGIKTFGEIPTTSQYLKDITQQDTSTMTKLVDVDETGMISNGTYSISSAEELAKLATMVNNGKISGGEFLLGADIDLASFGNWTPIGNTTNRFEGIFDGNGYSICNLYINQPNQDNLALFGASSNAEIKNIRLENIDIKGKYGISGICNVSGSTIIDNCYVSGSIQGADYVAGIVSVCDGGETTISNCFVDIDITSDTNAAGLTCVTTILDNIYNCCVIGNIKATNAAGGMGGTSCMSNISNSTFYGSIFAENIVGGITVRTADLNNCKFIGELSGGNMSSIFSVAADNITNCTAIGNFAGYDDVTRLTGAMENCSKQSFQKNLQVGINSSDSSQISHNSFFLLTGITRVQNIANNGARSLEIIDNLISKVAAKQTEFGAVQNRLESALDEISTQYENLVSSRSTLQDADIAEVSSEYIRQQILQQASATLLATSNQSPALALQLI